MPTAVGSNVKSSGKFLAVIAALLAGVQKDITGKMTLVVGGVSMTGAAIVAKLQAIQALFSAVATARNGYNAAVAAKNAGMQAAKQFAADLKKAVEAQFGTYGAQLLDFGITPPKPKAKLSGAEQAVATAKAEQTRAARGTMGKKAKAKVTVAGTPGVVVVGPDGQPLPGVTTGGPTAPAALPGDGASAAATPGTPAVNTPAPTGSSTSGNSGS